MERSTRGNHRRTLAVLMSGAFTYSLMQSLVIPILPTVQAHLNTSQNTVTWVLTAYLLAASVSTPIAGRLGDMLGKRRMLILSLVALCVGTLLATLATSVAVMITARVIQGLSAGLMPLSFGIIRDEFPEERVAGAIGLTSSLIGVGGSAGLVLAGPILDTLGYHWLFGLPLIVSVVTLVAVFFVVPESPVRMPGRIGWRAPLLLSAALVSLLIGVSKAPAWGWLSPEVLGLIALALVLAVAWVRVEIASDVPLIDMKMMRLRGVWTANVVSMMGGACMYTSFAFVPQLLQTPTDTGYGFGVSITESGLLLAPLNVAVFVSGVMVGRMVRRFGARRTMLVGCVINLVAMTVLVAAHEELWQIVLSMMLLGFGTGMSSAALPNVLIDTVSSAQTGVATGMNFNIRTIGGAIGTAVMSTVVTATVVGGGFPTDAGYTLGFAIFAVAALIGLAVGLLVPKAHQPTEWGAKNAGVKTSRVNRQPSAVRTKSSS